MIHKVLLEAKILQKFTFLEWSSKTKREECDQEHWTVCNKFGTYTPWETKYSLEVGSRVSLKVARAKQTLKTEIFRLLS